MCFKGHMLPVYNHVAHVPFRCMEKDKELFGPVTVQRLSRVPIILHASLGGLDGPFSSSGFALSHKVWSMRKRSCLRPSESKGFSDALFELSLSYNKARLIHEWA
jgi:hypothetical protein